VVSKAVKHAFDFHGKLVIVVGGTGTPGMGRATVLELAENGADIVVAARRAERLEALAKEVTALGQRCVTVPIDITAKGAPKSVVDKAMSEFRKIDFLVNTQFATVINELVDVEEEDWDRVQNTKLKSFWLMCKHVGRVMIQQKRGAIVNISGVAGLYPETYAGVYAVAQAGIMWLTKYLAGELGPHNIRVNAIAPGLTRVERNERTGISSGECLRSYLDSTALGRIATAEEQARGIVFLLSDYASYVNGHTLVIDGGPLPRWWRTRKTGERI